MQRLLKILAILILVVTVGIVVKIAIHSRSQGPSEEMDELVAGFPGFLEEQLQKEKPGARFGGAQVQSAQFLKNGHVQLKYSLEYDDITRSKTNAASPGKNEVDAELADETDETDEPIDSHVALNSSAELSHDGEVWKVLKVVNAEEQIDFQNSEPISASVADTPQKEERK